MVRKIPEMIPVFNHIESPLEIPASPTSENINSEDGLNVFMNIVNSSSKPLHDGKYYEKNKKNVFHFY